MRRQAACDLRPECRSADRRRRWGIELYFRWIKQPLAIRAFIGVSENAVRTHAFVALIVFLLKRMAHARQTAVTSPLEFSRLLRAHLMSCRDIADLRRPARAIQRQIPRQNRRNGDVPESGIWTTEIAT